MIEEKLSTLTHVESTGGGRADDRLFTVFYDELHRIAVRELLLKRAFILSPTALLQEVFLNVSPRESDALASIDVRLAECGDIARLSNVPDRTVQRNWHKAPSVRNCLMDGIANESQSFS